MSIKHRAPRPSTSVPLALLWALGGLLDSSALAAGRLVVAPSAQEMDRVPVIRVAGVAPGARVLVAVSLTDDAGVPWTSSAHFVAGLDGTIDLAGDAPVGGSYSGVDPAGLFWSMQPAADAAGFRRAESPASVAYDHGLGNPHFAGDAPVAVRLEASVAGRRIASTELRRVRYPRSVVETVLHEGRLRGALFQPRRPGSYPAVMLVPGSVGGLNRETAAQLAARGFVVLALAYFRYQDLPERSVRIPLEYFDEAMQNLAARSGQARVHLIGYSRGAEGALQIAHSFPARVASVTAVMPMSFRGATTDAQGVPRTTWTLAGAELGFAGTAEDNTRLQIAGPAPNARGELVFVESFRALMEDPEAQTRAAIDVAAISAPILMFAGDDDQVWPALAACERIVRARSALAANLTSCVAYPGVGHNIMRPGYPTALAASALAPGTQMKVAIGGRADRIAYARIDSWARTIAFIRGVESGP